MRISIPLENFKLLNANCEKHANITNKILIATKKSTNLVHYLSGQKRIFILTSGYKHFLLFCYEEHQPRSKMYDTPFEMVAFAENTQLF